MRCFAKFCSSTVIVVLIGIASRANAELITYDISGQIFNVFANQFGPVGSAVVPGALWSGQVTWETGLPDQNPGNPSLGEFVSTQASINLDIDAGVPGGLLGVSTSGAVDLTVQNGDPPTGTHPATDTFFRLSSDSVFPAVPSPFPPSTLFNSISVDFVDMFSQQPGSALSGIPSSISLLDFPDSAFFIKGTERNSFGQTEPFEILGSIFTATKVVPEPSSLFLVFLAGLTFAARRRRPHVAR